MSIKKHFGLKDLEKRYGKLNVSELLRSWRLCEGLSQRQFAHRLGISAQNLCDIEKGRKGISIDKAHEIATIIGYSAPVLIKMVIDEQIKEAGLKYRVELKQVA